MAQKKKKVSKQKVKQSQQEEKGGKLSGILLFLGTVAAICVVIVCMIRMDIGGFGSEVLAPIIGGVPGINKILPEGSRRDLEGESEEGMDVSQEELESKKQEESQQAESESASRALEESISEAQQKAQEESQFESILESQSIAESESIEVQSSAAADYVATYAKMDPKDAAAVLDNMVSGDIDLVVEILSNINASQRAKILANMDVNNASKVSVLISP